MTKQQLLIELHSKIDDGEMDPVELVELTLRYMPDEVIGKLVRQMLKRLLLERKG